ncbi:MAG TPA: sigma factor-like helix-turn-helix DNA-binding protein [Armatimonadota bacterium]|nr:sigma factor-like helix-turn-helix DNA-binding protein [Armatimonadota bacterium]
MNEVRQTFERLAGGLQKPVYNTAVRLAGNTEDGLELARETFVRAYSLYRAGRRAGAFRPWLYQLMIDLYHEQQILGAEAPAWIEGAAAGQDSSGSSSDLRGLNLLQSHSADERTVDEALAVLPVDLRATFLLCDMEGFSYAQIARILRCPVPSVAERVWDARRLLRLAIRKQSTRRPPIER